MVGVAGFEPATPASRTLLLVGKYQQNQRFSSSFNRDYRRLFMEFRWLIGGWKTRQRSILTKAMKNPFV